MMHAILWEMLCPSSFMLKSIYVKELCVVYLDVIQREWGQTWNPHSVSF